jgi:hypothetical protein
MMARSFPALCPIFLETSSAPSYAAFVCLLDLFSACFGAGRTRRHSLFLQVHFVFGGGANTLQHVVNALLNGVRNSPLFVTLLPLNYCTIICHCSLVLQLFVVAISQLKRPGIEMYLKWAETEWNRQDNKNRKESYEKQKKDSLSHRIFVSEIIHEVHRRYCLKPAFFVLPYACTFRCVVLTPPPV